ncbi:MAG: isoleucine--tRNA ligase [Flavobacteriales bacterium]|jgi:isoleucyl-tRNA synthetase|tara:strand:+ start:2372 stop:5743 length:3372 start_codon:yes stop_codon:yes gene_type:complete
MAQKYKEYKGLDLPAIADEVLKEWNDRGTFEKSIATREGKKPFVFFEGPPSANGMPGIHHVMARSIKDIFCRYKTLKGFQVKRKAGWDTHGLPVELGVEKELGITKEDIGTKISIEEYNQACRKAVMKYTDVWNDLTEKMGYWVDMEDPYITYENKYMESVWWIISQLHKKEMMYKGYTIQPYSPAAGTGLSSHEINQPGCYKDVTDTSAIAEFSVKEESLPQIEKFIEAGKSAVAIPAFIAWTTTPWTLPSNTALAVGPKVDYLIVNSINKYTNSPITVLVAEALIGKHFPVKKDVEFEVIGRCKGSDLVGIKYHQLFDYCLPMDSPEDAFRVIAADFVTIEDGTGIVHIAPTFGQDDAMVAKEAGIPPMLIADDNGNAVPLVDLQGKFVAEMGDMAGKYVKNEYYSDEERPDRSADVEISIKLKEQDKAFHVEKYVHSYPHCWRTDKPVLYYPLDSWFIKVTKARERMVELNKTINWKPKSTGTGRFGNWLSNANDWNLSRSRFWGIPIPIWRTEEGDEEICIGSAEELKAECEKAVAAGIMETNPLADFSPGDMSKDNYDTFDLHKNYVDAITLVSSKGKPMEREADLIDVWFDSGSMPYAQWHYPFENKELIDDNKAYPADFIAEGVDQTRGWFYTLHAIGTMVFDSVAYKAVISNGLVLDKKGQKMSKRLGNAADPFATLSKYGADATRWYMITNAQPWDNLKFDLDGITEVQRKFFGTLYNTYSFFGLYANIDNFSYAEEDVPFADRPEIDRWILSKLNTLISSVDKAYEEFEPTLAGRLIYDFTADQLSNWYVRLCRRRFWKGEYSTDKISAYQTLYKCLETLSVMMSPIAPFFSDRLFQDLDAVSGRCNVESVHLAEFPVANTSEIDTDLEARMEIAQKVSSMVLSLRAKEKIKVRQPLQRIMVPVLSETFKRQISAVKDLILSEVNIKEIEYLDESSNILVKRIKPNFKTLGPKFGKHMKSIAAAVNGFGEEEIATLEKNQQMELDLGEEKLTISMEDVEITTDDIPGWLVASEGGLTVALDITLTEELKGEGVARELVNRIQNMRKDSGFEVTDRIEIKIKNTPAISSAVEANKNYICAEVLADSLELVESATGGTTVEIDAETSTEIAINRI